MDKKLIALTLLILGASIYMFSLKPSNKFSQQFEKFKLSHNKYYWTTEEELYRKGIFLQNLAKIEEHNSNPQRTYSLGVTVFADITQQEFESMYLKTFKPLQFSSQVHQVSMKQAQHLVGDMDWQSAGKVTPIKNQGMCGSCWAFSATGAIESAYKISKGVGQIGISEQQLVDCSRGYGNQGCNGGWMQSAFEYAEDKGLASQDQYPYVARDQSCQRQSGRFSISGYVTVAPDCTQLQNALQGRPISVAVDATTWSLYKEGVLSNCGTAINHGVLLVGATDAFWRVKNSWGTVWGEAGYIRVKKGNTCEICKYGSYPVV